MRTPALLSADSLCAKHGRVMRGPDQQRYCPTCVTEAVSPFADAANSLRSMYLFALIMALAAVFAWVSIIPAPTSASDGQQNHRMYLMLIVPITFLIFLPSCILTGRIRSALTRMVGYQTMGYWYDGSHVTSDVLALALMSSAAYGFLWMAASLWFPEFVKPAKDPNSWFVARYLPLVVIVGGVMWGLRYLDGLFPASWAHQAQRTPIAPAGFLPRRGVVRRRMNVKRKPLSDLEKREVAGWAATTIYGLVIPLPYLVIQRLLANWVSATAANDDPMPAVVCTSLSVAAFSATWWGRRHLSAAEDAYRKSLPNSSVLLSSELETQVSVTGHSQCGKSTYFACAHQILSASPSAGPVALSTLTPGQELAGLIRTVWQHRTLVSQSARVEANTLVVSPDLVEEIQVNWLDIPGGLGNRSTEAQFSPEALQRFGERVANCDAMVMMISAQALLASKEGDTPPVPGPPGWPPAPG